MSKDYLVNAGKSGPSSSYDLMSSFFQNKYKNFIQTTTKALFLFPN